MIFDNESVIQIRFGGAASVITLLLQDIIAKSNGMPARAKKGLYTEKKILNISWVIEG